MMLSRRKLLAAGIGAFLLAATLAACGTESKSQNSVQSPQGQVQQPINGKAPDNNPLQGKWILDRENDPAPVSFGITGTRYEPPTFDFLPDGTLTIGYRSKTTGAQRNDVYNYSYPKGQVEDEDGNILIRIQGVNPPESLIFRFLIDYEGKAQFGVVDGSWTILLRRTN
jgi:hypothetical protein